MHAECWQLIAGCAQLGCSASPREFTSPRAQPEEDPRGLQAIMATLSLFVTLLGLIFAVQGEGWGVALSAGGMIVLLASLVSVFGLGEEDGLPPSTRLPPEQIPPWFRERMEESERIY